jgi:hypothetical protein
MKDTFALRTASSSAARVDGSAAFMASQDPKSESQNPLVRNHRKRIHATQRTVQHASPRDNLMPKSLPNVLSDPHSMTLLSVASPRPWVGGRMT